MSPDNTPSKTIVQCPHCKSMVRQDRLQKHILRAHASRASGKPLATHVKRTQGKTKKIGKSPINTQYGKVIEEIPTAKFGIAEGSTLGVKRENGQKISYEQATCPCNGSNERCMRCDGTGLYVRKIMGDPSLNKLHNKRIFKPDISKITQESNFSNDYRGGDFGIREIGRFNSNPLHDDHD